MKETTFLQKWLKVPNIIAAIAILLLLTAIFVPFGDVGNNFKMSTYSKKEWGAFGVFEVSRRVGFEVSQHRSSFTDSLPFGKTLVMLSPSDYPSDEEWDMLEKFIKDGGSVITDRWEPLGDSLNITRGGIGLSSDSTIDGPFIIGGKFKKNDPSFFQAFTNNFSMRGSYPTNFIPRDSTNLKQPGEIFAIQWFIDTVSLDTMKSIVGLKYGKGKIVLLNFAEPLRNFVAWDGTGIVAFIRAAEWIGNKELVFDEYHHGYGDNINREMGLFRWVFISNPLGRFSLQIIVALIILTLALAHRPIVPITEDILKRRSPLEHIGALGNLYHRSNSVQLAADRLLHGLRRRNSYNTQRSASHEEYLRHITQYFPAVKPYTDIIISQISDPHALNIKTVGSAVAEIESIISRG